MIYLHKEMESEYMGINLQQVHTIVYEYMGV
jgi:hypothetical protein